MKSCSQKHTLKFATNQTKKQSFFLRVFFLPTQEDFFATIFLFFHPAHTTYLLAKTSLLILNAFNCVYFRKLQAKSIRTKIRAAHNKSLAKVAVLRMKVGAENRHLRQARKRYAQCITPEIVLFNFKL